MARSTEQSDNTPRAARSGGRNGPVDLDMRIGAKVLLSPVGFGEKIWCQMVGMVPGKYILVRVPADPAYRGFFKPETEMTVRYLHEQGEIYGFTTAVVTLSLKPLPLLYLTFPRKVERANLRRHDRVNCFLPAALFYDGAEGHGPVVDLSKGGCKIVMEPDGGGLSEVAKDAEVFCQLTVFGADQALYIKGVVKSVDTSKGMVAIGVQFEDMDEDVARLIDDYVSNVKTFSH